jgi:hypothetical protein
MKYIVKNYSDRILLARLCMSITQNRDVTCKQAHHLFLVCPEKPLSYGLVKDDYRINFDLN